jgi:hypothetical protein
MRLGNKKKRPAEGFASDTRFWSAVKRRVEDRLRQCAAYLDRKTLYWNRGSKLLALALFCLVFGSVCLWLLMRAMGFFR